MRTFLEVRERDGVFAIRHDDLLAYAGPSQLIACTLTFLLFERAFADLSPGAPPRRDDIRLRTAFPGDGVHAAMEMVARAITDGRLVVDTRLGPPEAPPAPAGRFYFEVAIGSAARAYWPKPGVFDARFIDMVVNYQDGSGGPKAQADYLAYKHDLIGRLRSMAVGDLFESRDIPAWAVPPPPAPIEVIDHGTLLRVSFADCVAYHGRTSIGGLALGYRLLQHAFARLSPGTAPDRDSISVFTAFPGPGLRDALELVTRVVTRGAYKADPAADVPAPAGVTGRMYFEVEIGGRRLRLALVDGALDPEFIRLGRKSKAGEATPADEARWTELKEALAVAVLSTPAADLFVEL